MSKEMKSILQLLQIEDALVKDHNNRVHNIGAIESNIGWYSHHPEEDPGGYFYRNSVKVLPEKKKELEDIHERLTTIRAEIRSILAPIMEVSNGT